MSLEEIGNFQPDDIANPNNIAASSDELPPALQFVRDVAIPLIVWFFMARFLFREVRSFVTSGMLNGLTRGPMEVVAAPGESETAPAEAPQSERMT
jgi:hypothetical protein